MPKRDWDRNTAPLVILALLVVFVGVVVWDSLEYPRPGSIDRRYEASKYADRAQNRILLECAGMTGPEQSACAAEVMASEREEHRNEQDLNAQRYMAFWAFWMVGTSALGALAALVGLVLLRWTWQETKRSADVAREVGEAQIRAYLTLDHIQLVFLGKHSQPPWTAIQFRPWIVNVGSSPARFVRTRVVTRLVDRRATEIVVNERLQPSTLAVGNNRKVHIGGEAIDWQSLAGRDVATTMIVVIGTVEFENVFKRQESFGFAVRIEIKETLSDPSVPADKLPTCEWFDLPAQVATLQSNES